MRATGAGADATGKAARVVAGDVADTERVCVGDGDVVGTAGLAVVGGIPGATSATGSETRIDGGKGATYSMGQY